MARYARRGYTLFELIAVMVVLLILAAVVIPSVVAFRGDSRPRAAADAIRGELAIARARAKDEGRPYRVALSEDGRRIRRGPDESNFAEAAAFEHASGSAIVVEYELGQLKAAVVAEADSTPPTTANGWVTLATVQPDGTCREDNVLVALKDDDGTTIHLRVRGLTGRTRFVPHPGGGAP